jgi:predicted site-specific integrase-resolvase
VSVDPLDVDSDQYVTLAEAVRRTSRSRPTILRWVKAGTVRTIERQGVRGFHLADLVDAEAAAHYNAARTRKQ